MPVSEWGPAEEHFWEEFSEFMGADEESELGRELFDLAAIDLDLPFDFIEDARHSFEEWINENYDPYWTWEEDFPWEMFREWYGLQ